MNRIHNAKYDETYYEEILDNGLDVIVWHKPSYTTSSCIFATPYGSLDLDQIDEKGKIIHFPAGIAHFLEHKLFESDHGDVMSDFSSMGANVNAFTSYAETVYYFTTASEMIEKPLNLLLDFVQDLSITDESVEKEKGIIDQELSMYLQMPDSRMLLETLKSMYLNHPLKNDIGGTAETVEQITKPLLEECYRVNYHPANMMAVIVTPQDPEKIMDIVRRNQAAKKFVPADKVKRHAEAEPITVVRKHYEQKMDVSESKACIGIKLPVIQESDEDRVTRDWALHLTLDAYFSSVNPAYQTWLDQKKITPYFGYEEDMGRDYSMMMFYDETENPEEFEAFIMSQIENCLHKKMREDDLLQLKNREIGSNLHMFNVPEQISIHFFRDRQNGVSLFRNFEILSKLDAETCWNLLKNLDYSNEIMTVIHR